MTRTTKRAAATLLLLIGAGMLPACNIVGAAAYIVEGPPRVAAVTSLDADRPTVIFIDDRSSRVPRRSLRVIIGQTAEETLIAEKVVKQQNMIAAQSSLRAAMSEPPDEPLSIADIGLAVGADVVVYVTIDAWTLSKDAGSFSPLVSARVKITDASSRTRLWPADPQGYVLRVEPATRAADLPRSSAERAAAEADLAKRTGEALARMFFESDKTAVRDR